VAGLVVVILFHAGLPVPGGFIGVDIFFVISGFVITAMLRREYLASSTLKLSRFYIRRFLRLWPALALVVTVVALISLFLLSPFGPQQTMAATGIGSMLMSANFVIAHAAGDLLLMRESLVALPEAVHVARAALRRVRQNLRWAAGYNLAAIPLAALGLMPPWLAALGMSLSSLLVVFNARRPLAREPRP